MWCLRAWTWSLAGTMQVPGGVGGCELRVVKHRSEIYKLVNKLFHWVV
jgi:hypothetical protein